MGMNLEARIRESRENDMRRVVLDEASAQGEVAGK
jgi:hypothetical protein